MMKSVYFIVFSVLLLSCQKDISPDLPQNQLPFDSCRIKAAYYYGGSGGINDSANFTYSNGKLIKVSGEFIEVDYQYAGNRLASMRYYEIPGNILYRIDSLFYVNDTTISKLIVHDYDLYNYTDTTHSVLTFNYNGSRLTGLQTINSYEGYSETDTSFSEFRYTDGNITSMFTRSSYWADDSVYYQYDNNPNYFSNVSKYFFLADPFFQLHAGFDPHIAYFISRNNVINYTYYTNVDYPVSYTVDSLNHPILISMGGFDYMGYKYECP